MFRCLLIVLIYFVGNVSFGSLEDSSGLGGQSYNSYRIDEGHDFFYKDAFEMRDNRMVGIGANIGGSTGLLGLNVELNLDTENSFITGFGTGSGYRAVSMEWKRLLQSDRLSPFIRLGYSGWFNSTGESAASSNSILLKDFLNQEEINRGNFRVDILNMGLGLEYHFLSGDYTGLGVFAQAMLMFGFSNHHVIPNGSIGSIYYF